MEPDSEADSAPTVGARQLGFVMLAVFKRLAGFDKANPFVGRTEWPRAAGLDAVLDAKINRVDSAFFG